MVISDFFFTNPMAVGRCSADRTVKMWDLNIGEETASLGGHKREVVAVRFCPRTHCVFSASQNIVKVKQLLQSASLCATSLSHNK